MANELTAKTTNPKKQRRKLLKTNTGKTIIWILGNAAFGLAPLLIMLVLEMLAPNTARAAGEEVKHLINDGLLMFISGSMMGACVVDILNDGLPAKPFELFALILFPFAVLFWTCLVYSLIVCKVLEVGFFTSHKKVNAITILFTVIYLSLAKYYLYKGGLKK